MDLQHVIQSKALHLI